MTDDKKVTQEEVREALRKVSDPELHIDVVSLGLIRDINVEASPVHIKMILTTPFCPFGPHMIRQVKETATQAVGEEVEVEMLMERWHPDLMEDPSLLGF